MKYTTVKLTEDQVKWLRLALETNANALEYNLERSPNPKFYKEQIAFNRRILTKLAKASHRCDNTCSVMSHHIES